MSNKIKLLPPEVIDQIAAGEVVERPAHLVKELVENSLDAGATQIEVEFAQGGRWIRVEDNGQGMAPEDLKWALSRHATSKIHRSDDLWALQSFGFRGEALSAIAAVSRLQIVSRPPQATQGFQIRSDWGQLSDLMPSGAEVGTRVVVEDLFANVPARLKFLKSEAAEHQQIKNVLKALALAFPQVQFRILQKGKLLHYWPAQKQALDRVQEVLEPSGALFWVEAQDLSIQVRAALSPPHLTAATSRQIWLFAQRRWVQDRSLQAAVMESYRNLLMHGEYPIAAVWVDVDPEDIDVNIHPTKSQVKFRRPQDVFRVVMQSLRRALEKAPWVGEITQASAGLRSLTQESSSRNLQVKEALGTYSARSFSDPEFFRTQYPRRPELKLRESGPASQPSPGAETQSPSASSALGRWASLQVVGQSHLTYIVAQSEKAVVFIDQHAAHERVVFERLMAAWRGQKIDLQRFLVPLVVDMEAALVEALMSQSADLAKLGVLVEQAGPESVAIVEAPSLLEGRGLSEALLNMAREVQDQGGSFAVEKVVADLCATMACHSVIRAGQALGRAQMEQLLREMDEHPLSSFCPHGRPVFVEYPVAELEKDFGRKV